MLEHADAVVTLSSGSAARLRNAARRVHVVPNAPGTGAKPRLGDPHAPPSLLFLGRLDARKGVHLLVDAFGALHAERPDVRLVLAGDGPEGPRLARGIHSLGLAHAVELPGWLDDAEKAAALQRATCFVLPSIVEGMPLALLEAMAGGVAIVATAVGSVPETVGGAGIVVPPGDATALAEAVRRVVDDPALARTLGETGRRRVDERYSARHFEQGLAAVYDGVLGER